MELIEITDYLREFNPWWDRSEELEEAGWPERDRVQTVRSLLPLRQAIAVTGLRRTGKSTLIRQIIAKLLRRGEVPSKRICYFSFDEAMGPKRSDLLEKILRTYVEGVLREKIGRPSSKIYLFLDEIQLVSKWSDVIKRFYDLSRNYKFIVSGSSSLFIKKKVTESLAGRLLEQILPPLSFAEYLKLKGLSPTPTYSISQWLSLSQADQGEVIASLPPSLQVTFWEFLYSGQFPEMIDFQEPALIRSYLRDSILRKVIFEDIPRLFQVEQIEDLYHIFSVMSRESSSLLQYQNLATDTSISVSSIKRYIGYLKQAYLVDLLTNYSKKLRKERRQLQKGYATSSNFISLFLQIKPDSPVFQDYAGYFAETYLFNRLKLSSDRLSFWRKGEREVDFVVEGEGQTYLVEGKSGGRVRFSDLKGLELLRQKWPKAKPILISAQRSPQQGLSSGGSITNLPLWLVG